mmetsp:Transcript_18966/g.44541  ORF Transcript_18966/g.44541 Transcript_18966/m.44541 type:complete len:172 (-) Transcript_18966:225-740(-)
MADRCGESRRPDAGEESAPTIVGAAVLGDKGYLGEQRVVGLCTSGHTCLVGLGPGWGSIAAAPVLTAIQSASFPFSMETLRDSGVNSLPGVACATKGCVACVGWEAGSSLRRAGSLSAGVAITPGELAGLEEAVVRTLVDATSMLEDGWTVWVLSLSGPSSATLLMTGSVR